MNNYVIFDVSNPSFKQSVEAFLGEKSLWVNNNVLILAKKLDQYGNVVKNYVLDSPIDESTLKDGEQIIYNPIIESFVGTHAYIDENLRH
jgi:hypothetical protein